MASAGTGGLFKVHFVSSIFLTQNIKAFVAQMTAFVGQTSKIKPRFTDLSLVLGPNKSWDSMRVDTCCLLYKYLASRRQNIGIDLKKLMFIIVEMICGQLCFLCTAYTVYQRSTSLVPRNTVCHQPSGEARRVSWLTRLALLGSTPRPCLGPWPSPLTYSYIAYASATISPL